MFTKIVLISIPIISIILTGCGNMNQADSIKKETDSVDIDKDLEFNPVNVVPPFPPITHVPVIKASEVVDQVTDKELVLGTLINGEARAYPINMLTGPSREIINDTLGNRAIAATW